MLGGANAVYLMERVDISGRKVELKCGQEIIRERALTGLPARAPKHRRMRGGGDGSGGVTGGGSQLDCVPRT